jgi:hypothetical protein
MGHSYWRFVARRSLGLIRAMEEPDGRVSLLVRATRLNLLCFDPPRYERDASGASATWRIAGGALVMRRGRGHGFLRLTLGRPTGPPESKTIRAAMEVRGFYPLLRGSGRLAIAGAALYNLTQRVVHRAMARAYLRSLGGARIPDGTLANG